MKGSTVKNIKLDPNKQKIVECDVCGVALVVGKFAKNKQTCMSANQFPSNSKCKLPIKGKKKSARDKIADTKTQNAVRRLDKSSDDKINKEDTFGVKLTKLMKQLDFDIDNKRRYKKRYGIDGGGIVTIYPSIVPGVAGKGPTLEYFSVIIQRAVGVNEDFRNFMPPDAASDCELLASELGEQVIARPDIGTIRCDSCGSLTDEFGVDPNQNKVLCIKPNGCFKKAFTNVGAEALE